MKYAFIIASLFTLLLTSCGGTGEPVNPKGKAATKKNEPFAKRVKHEIEARLKIAGTEKYAMRTYWAYLNNDTIKDAVITVNRAEFAMDEAIRMNRTAKAEEVGYLGNYNYFFYYDGMLDLLSEPVSVPSSPGRELDVSFENITSKTKQDLVIDYRIRNSGWRSYFTASGQGTLSLMFQWKWFDHIGEAVPEALNHVLEDNPNGRTKDIAIYESTIDNYPKEIRDVYAYAPSITKKGDLLYRFFFDPAVQKFRLYSPQMLSSMGLTAKGELKRD